MTMPLSPMWRPTSEAELRAALDEGAFTESHHRDAKQFLRNNKEQAKDMASFAIDGGLLVIGVEEQNGQFSLAPLERTPQVEETPARIALTRCTPPLPVSVTWLESEEKSDYGYLLIDIPASSLAPHQVDGRYWGRGDKEKRQLPDSEVERLILTRDASLSVIRNLLANAVENDPRPNGNLGHLHVVARPHTNRHRMFISYTHGPQWEQNLRQLVRAAADNVRGGATPSLARCELSFRTADGAGVSFLERKAFNDPSRELSDLRVAVLEGGGAWLFCSRAAVDGELYGVKCRAVIDSLIAEQLRGFLLILSILSRETGYGGSWDLGVAVTGIDGAIAKSAIGPHGDDLDVEDAHTYDRPEYRRTARASLIELEEAPGSILDVLLGPLLRSINAGQRSLMHLD